MLNAREQVEAVLPRLEWFGERELVANIRTVIAALDEAVREMRARELHHFEEEQTSAELAAVIERVRVWAHDPYNRQRGRIAGLDNILSSAPADALRQVTAEAWFAGYDKGNLDGYFGGSDERTGSPYADLDPHREGETDGNA